MFAPTLFVQTILLVLALSAVSSAAPIPERALRVSQIASLLARDFEETEALQVRSFASAAGKAANSFRKGKGKTSSKISSKPSKSSGKSKARSAAKAVAGAVTTGKGRTSSANSSSVRKSAPSSGKSRAATGSRSSQKSNSSRKQVSKPKSANSKSASKGHLCKRDQGGSCNLPSSSGREPRPRNWRLWTEAQRAEANAERDAQLAAQRVQRANSPPGTVPASRFKNLRPAPQVQHRPSAETHASAERGRSPQRLQAAGSSTPAHAAGSQSPQRSAHSHEAAGPSTAAHRSPSPPRSQSPPRNQAPPARPPRNPMRAVHNAAAAANGDSEGRSQIHAHSPSRQNSQSSHRSPANTRPSSPAPASENGAGPSHSQHRSPSRQNSQSSQRTSGSRLSRSSSLASLSSVASVSSDSSMSSVESLPRVPARVPLPEPPSYDRPARNQQELERHHMEAQLYLTKMQIAKANQAMNLRQHEAETARVKERNGEKKAQKAAKAAKAEAERKRKMERNEYKLKKLTLEETQNNNMLTQSHNNQLRRETVENNKKSQRHNDRTFYAGIANTAVTGVTNILSGVVPNFGKFVRG